MSDRDEGVILVVEDDPAVRNLVTCALDVHGYRSREASTATAALADVIHFESRQWKYSKCKGAG